MKSLLNRIKFPVSYLQFNARDLRGTRFFFYSIVLALTLPVDFSAYAQIPKALFSPTALVSWLGYGIPDAFTLTVITWVWRASLVLSALGLFSVAFRILAFVLGFYLLTLDSQFGWHHRESIPCLIAMFVLIFAPCTELGAQTPKKEPWRYSWPGKLILFLFVYIYFSAGISKLRHAGFAWVDGDTLLNHVIYARYIWFERLEALHSTWLAALVFDNLSAKSLSILILFLELISPLAFFSRQAATLLVCVLTSTQILIYFLMGPNYLLNLSLLAFFLPWSRWWRLS